MIGKVIIWTWATVLIVGMFVEVVTERKKRAA